MVLYRWVSYFLGMLHGFCVGLWHAEPTVCGAGVLRSSATSGTLGVWSTVFLGIWEVISQLEMGIWIIWPSCFDSETHQRGGADNVQLDLYSHVMRRSWTFSCSSTRMSYYASARHARGWGGVGLITSNSTCIPWRCWRCCYVEDVEDVSTLKMLLCRRCCYDEDVEDVEDVAALKMLKMLRQWRCCYVEDVATFRRQNKLGRFNKLRTKRQWKLWLQPLCTGNLVWRLWWMPLHNFVRISRVGC